MPRLKNTTPKYRHHKASGQAIVTLDGQDFYLGPHGSRPSRREYERLVGEWLQNGRSLPADPHTITVAGLINAYRKHAETYYVKNGKQTDEVKGIKAALRYLRQTYGDKRVAEFGPLSLEVVRQKMIEAGICRGYINQNVGRIKRCFKWESLRNLSPSKFIRHSRPSRDCVKANHRRRKPNPSCPSMMRPSMPRCRS